MNSAELQRNIRDMQQAYRKDGYILAKVSDLRMDMDGSLHIKINEGSLEGYKIKGNKKTKDYVMEAYRNNTYVEMFMVDDTGKLLPKAKHAARV